MKLRVHGKGQASPQGGAAGDLYVVIEVVEHEKFNRIDDELVCDLKVPMIDACLGTSVQFESLDGPIDVVVPQGTQPDDLIRIKHRGLPILNRSKRGDLHLRVKVEIPKKISKKQRELLASFSQLN